MRRQSPDVSLTADTVSMPLSSAISRGGMSLCVADGLLYTISGRSVAAATVV